MRRGPRALAVTLAFAVNRSRQEAGVGEWQGTADQMERTVRAYCRQDRQRQAAGPLIGWKLALPSRATQQQLGVHEPICGFLAVEHSFDLGEPRQVDRHIQPRTEPEIVRIIGPSSKGRR